MGCICFAERSLVLLRSDEVLVRILLVNAHIFGVRNRIRIWSNS
jgi:hypothetical protein